MIFESATFEIEPGSAETFETGVAAAVAIFRRAKGCKSMQLHRVIESPLRYRLVVGWETIEDHVVHFRNSPEFNAWRKLVGGTFSAPPVVEHSTVVVTGFDNG